MFGSIYLGKSYFGDVFQIAETVPGTRTDCGGVFGSATFGHVYFGSNIECAATPISINCDVAGTASKATAQASATSVGGEVEDQGTVIRGRPNYYYETVNAPILIKCDVKAIAEKAIASGSASIAIGAKINAFSESQMALGFISYGISSNCRAKNSAVTARGDASQRFVLEMSDEEISALLCV